MPELVPVDQQPEFDHTLVPVDHDPFSTDPTGMIAPANAMLASQNLRDPATFDPKTYAPSQAMPTPFNVDPMSDTYAAAAPAVKAAVTGLYHAAQMPDAQAQAQVRDVAANVVKPLAEMVATPARYAAPNPYPPGSEEASWYEDQREKMGADWAPQTAMTLAGMGAPAAEAGAAGIFGGKLSKLADHAAIAKAEQMEADGAVPSAIWKETGTARGADKQWRQEIDDSAAKLKTEPSDLLASGLGGPPMQSLDDVLHHPELYQAYPHLQGVKVEPLPDEIAKNTNGDYSAYTNTIRMNKNLSPEDFKSTLLHEIQHAVQNKEGFAPGDNPAAHIPPALGPAQKNFEAVRADTQAEVAKTLGINPTGVEFMKDLIRREKYGPEAAKQNIPPGFVTMFQKKLAENPDVARRLGNLVDSEKMIDDAHAAAFAKYRAAMGEVEARNVQDRMNMSPSDRAGIHPIYNEEIPRSQQRDPRVGGANSDAPAASAAAPKVKLVPASDPVKSFASSEFVPPPKNHNYDLISIGSGDNVGAISLDASNPRSLYIDLIHNYEGGGKNTLGPEVTRDVVRGLQSIYPDLQRVAGKRISGARVESGPGAKFAETYVKLTPEAAERERLRQIDMFKGLITKNSKDGAGEVPVWGMQQPDMFQKWKDQVQRLQGPNGTRYLQAKPQNFDKFLPVQETPSPAASAAAPPPVQTTPDGEFSFQNDGIYRRATGPDAFHGSRQYFKLGSKEPLYLTNDPSEAAGFAKGYHLGGKGSEPQVHSFTMAPGKIRDINPEINDAIMNDGEIDDAIQKATAEELGPQGTARYLRFTHPSLAGKDDFEALVSLHPHEDLGHFDTAKLKDDRAWSEMQRSAPNKAMQAAAPAPPPIAPAASAAPPSIRAYHGSPHDFDAFSMDKIGTGEGAQAYGRGLYFAENEGVARSYRSINAPPGQGAGAGKLANDALQMARDTGLDGDAAKKFAMEYLTNQAPKVNALSPQHYYDAVNNFDALTTGKGAHGRMYEVNINADPEHFLDWDKPLSEQPHVYDKLSQLPQFQRQQAMIDSDRLVQTAKDNGIPPLVAIKVQSELAKGTPLSDAIAKVKGLSTNPDWAAQTDKLQSLVGDKAVTMRTVLPKEWTGASIANNVAGMKPNEIAQTLHGAGIPGIKYLDQGSRGNTRWVARHPQGGVNDFADEQSARSFVAKNPEYSLEPPNQSRNYVVFDDKLIDIIKKYGIAGLPAGLAAAAARQFVPVDNDPFADGS